MSCALSVKKSAHRTAVSCACRIPSPSDGAEWKMQNPVEWKNPAIHRRITGFESLLYDRLCRGRYSDLGSIFHCNFVTILARHCQNSLYGFKHCNHLFSALKLILSRSTVAYKESNFLIIRFVFLPLQSFLDLQQQSCLNFQSFPGDEQPQ